MANLAQSLGGDLALDTAEPADGAARVGYSDGRGISFRVDAGEITGSPAVSIPAPDDITLADQAL
ncbi:MULTISPECIES: hypothetical protein [Streptomyces]|uniref:hypothetical protein n=1 Tax=Streptomyces TaxID=1883 RepID=UPI000F51761C|nr:MULTISPECIES: hypothetical protein [Streptomyces]